MIALRASYSIDPELLHKFNALAPAGERSRVIQRLMAEAVKERESRFEALGREFETRPDFAEARAAAQEFDATASDGLDD